MNPLIKTFSVAVAAVSHRRLVKFTANDGEVAPATGPDDAIAGVVDFPGGAGVGKRVDVVLFGPAEVECGGAIAPGGFFVSDANGRAVAAAPAQGVNATSAGRILVKAASGEIARGLINPARIQG